MGGGIKKMALLLLMAAAAAALLPHGHAADAPALSARAASRREAHCDSLPDAPAKAACAAHMQHALLMEERRAAAAAAADKDDSTASLQGASDDEAVTPSRHHHGHHRRRVVNPPVPAVCAPRAPRHAGRAYRHHRAPSSPPAYDPYPSEAGAHSTTTGGPDGNELPGGYQASLFTDDVGDAYDDGSDSTKDQGGIDSAAHPSGGAEGAAGEGRLWPAAAADPPGRRRHGHVDAPAPHHRSYYYPVTPAAPSVLRISADNTVYVLISQGNETFASNSTTLINGSITSAGVDQANLFQPATPADAAGGPFSWLLAHYWRWAAPAAEPYLSVVADGTGAPVSFTITGTWGQGQNYIASAQYTGSNPATEGACISVPDVDTCTLYVSRPNGLFTQYSGQLAASPPHPSLAAGPLTIGEFIQESVRHPGTPLAAAGQLTYTCTNLQCSSLNAAGCVIARQAVVILFVSAPACSESLTDTVRTNIYNFMAAQPGVNIATLTVEVLCAVQNTTGTRVAAQLEASEAPLWTRGVAPLEDAAQNQTLLFQVFTNYAGSAEGAQDLVQTLDTDACGTGLCDAGVNVTAAIAAQTDPTTPASLSLAAFTNSTQAPLVLRATYAQESAEVVGIPVGLSAAPGGVVACSPNPALTDSAGVATFVCQAASAGAVTLTATTPNPLDATSPLAASVSAQLQGGAALALSGGPAAPVVAGAPFNLTATYSYPNGPLQGVNVAVLFDPASAGSCTPLGSGATDASGQVRFSCSVNTTANATASAANPAGGTLLSSPVTIDALCTGTCPNNETSIGVVPCPTLLAGGCCRAADFTIANYSHGSIDGQNGWTSGREFAAGPPCQGTVSVNFDQAITAVTEPSGEQLRVWRVSNAVVNGGLADQTFSYESCQVAGETNASLWNSRPLPQCGSLTDGVGSQPGQNATTNKFFWRATFRSAVNGTQTGLLINLASTAQMSNSRNTNLQVRDSGGGLGLYFAVRGANGVNAGEAVVATNLTYTDWHTVQTEIEFVDGVTVVNGTMFGNDIVKTFVNGQLAHTGTGYDAYWRTQPIPYPRASNSFAIIMSGGAAPALSGKGLYFREIIVGNTP